MINQSRLTVFLVVLMSALLMIPTARAADFSIGGGIGIAPDYEGSDNYELVPVPTGSVKFDNGMYIKMLGLNLRANLIPSDFFHLGPVYNYHRQRSDVDNSRVDNMRNVSDAHEVGLFGGIEWKNWYVFLEFLRDTGDAHDSAYGSLKAGYNWIINEAWALKMGAFSTYAGDDYMDTYFGVTKGDSRRSGLDEFKAEGDIKDVGLDLGLNWRFWKNFDLRTLLQAKWLLNDADETSPVTDEGSQFQGFAALLVAWNF